jgi:hypothetical protein
MIIVYSYSDIIRPAVMDDSVTSLDVTESTWLECSALFAGVKQVNESKCFCECIGICVSYRQPAFWRKNLAAFGLAIVMFLFFRTASGSRY